MNCNIKILFLVFIGLGFFQSCMVKHPKYATYGQVISLETGMSYTDLKDSLGIEPHYVKEYHETGFKTYVFKYRLKEIRRIPLLMKRNTGFETEGDFVDLLVVVNNQGEVVRLETCPNCGPVDENTTVIDFDSLIRGITTMITVTLPAFLVFLSNGN